MVSCEHIEVVEWNLFNFLVCWSWLLRLSDLCSSSCVQLWFAQIMLWVLCFLLRWSRWHLNNFQVLIILYFSFKCLIDHFLIKLTGLCLIFFNWLGFWRLSCWHQLYFRLSAKCLRLQFIKWSLVSTCRQSRDSLCSLLLWLVVSLLTNIISSLLIWTRQYH